MLKCSQSVSQLINSKYSSCWPSVSVSSLRKILSTSFWASQTHRLSHGVKYDSTDTIKPPRKWTLSCEREIETENSRNFFTCRKQSSALPAHQADSPFSRASCGGAGPAEEEAVIFSSGIAPDSIPRGSPPNDANRKIINWLKSP